MAAEFGAVWRELPLVHWTFIGGSAVLLALYIAQLFRSAG